MMTSPLAAVIENFPAARVLCVGDVMLDRFIHGAVERISPEAPIPVLSIHHESTMPGGAGNVVRNLSALGVNCGFITVVGDDKTGAELMRMVAFETGVAPFMLVETGRMTTQKTRYIAGNQQMLRADRETRMALKPSTEEQIIGLLREEIPGHDIIILSDYGKGVLTDAVTRAAIDSAAQHGKRVVVDPKTRDFSKYRGAFLVSPNLAELTQASATELHGDAEISRAAHALLSAHALTSLLVTRGRDGMSLITHDAPPLHIPAHAREVFDVSGAGDTVIATLSAALAVDASLADATQLANIAAGIVVGKVGTAAIYPTDLKNALADVGTPASKILSLPAAVEQVAIWRRSGLKTGFTNGCFDLMHPGHVSLLEEAKKRCDRLVVGLNSDASVRRLKGETRPVTTETARATLLAALSVVDAVVIFEEDTPLHLLEQLRPDILYKGADYTRDQVVGADLVASYGGEIILIPLQPGHSTTGILAKIAHGG